MHHGACSRSRQAPAKTGDTTEVTFPTMAGRRRAQGRVNRHANGPGTRRDARTAATQVFSEPEMDTVEALSPFLEGKTARQRNPDPPRSLARASWAMARLGGWNCYYGPPGTIVMHREMERFHGIRAGWLLGSKMERDVRFD